MLLAALALGSSLVIGAADERSIQRFLADLQSAADRNDRAAIARMVHYLIEVAREAPGGDAVLTYALTVSTR